MFKKIEIDILLFMIIEGIFLLFFFKENLLTILFGIILNIKKNKITKLILLMLSIPLCMISLVLIVNFINYNILKDYSLVIIIISFLLISFYLISKKFHTFIKAAEISFYFFITIKLISLILLIPKINIHNLNISYNTSINYHFIIIGLIILYLYKSLNYLTNYQINKKGIIILINPLLIKIITTSVLGNTLSNIYNYPYVNYLKTIRYFDLIERIDGLLSFEYLFSFFFLFCFILLNIKLIYKS